MNFLKTLGSIIAALGVIGALIGLAIDFPDFREKYFYKHDLWTGKFSTTTEYTIITGDYPETPADQPRFVVNIESAEGSGSVHGEMFSEGICKYNPISWYFFLDSDTPGLQGYASLGQSRKFILSYLRDSKKVPMAEIKISISEPHDSPVAMKIEPLAVAPGLEIPDKIIAGKDLEAYREDYDYLQDYCGKTSQDFHIKMIEMIKKDRANEEKGKLEQKMLEEKKASETSNPMVNDKQ
ncbi:MULTISPECIES: hypothetical protein [Pseudomonas]|uniref:hypothetical protein n=1 Tax=Pseudomonas TaxID=286 RepID=UPI0025AA4CBB|nr:hypothetical protein [Pseudomonas asiatica]MDM9555977.1 hypothetical protein [Pseudomonas asiatica]